MRTITTVCLALFLGVVALGQCRAPQYRAAVTLTDSESELVESISLPLQEFGPSKLVCLAANLKERYSGRSSIIVNIFSSHEAASRSIGVLPQEPTKSDLALLTQMHARYVFDVGRHEDYVEIIPCWPENYNTRIDLPVASTTHCRLEIDSRCVVALEDPTYPYEALKRKASGSATLTGTVTRSGKVGRIRVVKNEDHLEGAKNLLANVALQNLSSWRLEPGPRQAPIQITYSYVIDKSLPGGQTQVRWVLPNEVVVSGHTPE